jgi:DNA-binding MarR family transcriptional regulator
MVDVVPLSPGDRAVLERIAVEWVDENITGAEIAVTLHKTSGDTMRRIARLVRMGFVQQKYGARGRFSSDIRRIGKS